MKRGYLSQYFKGVGVKSLTSVEVDGERSNQHEFQGVKSLRDFLGTERDGKRRSKFLYLSDDDDQFISADGFMTWYDARANRPERSAEFHLYYSSPNAAVDQAQVGDTLLVAQLQDESLLAIVIKADSTTEQQALWLFGFERNPRSAFETSDDLDQEKYRIDYVSRLILENLGIEVEESDESFLEAMIKKWDGNFPTTKEFSSYARSSLEKLRPEITPDIALMTWMEREEMLFRQLEKYQLANKISAGFSDVDEFVSFSLSVQNRRKSRVGHAFENHLVEIFTTLGLRFARHSDAITENNKKPDFLFPGKAEYHNLEFDPQKLTMLGSKSTCKDRWRQVVTEADRIETKHLITLEAAISSNQTDEMKSHGIQLVVPAPIQNSYTPAQQRWLLDLEEFTQLVLQRQNA